MNKKIQTYKELLEEEQKLKELFEIQKKLAKYEIEDVKKEFEPVLDILHFLRTISLKNSDNPIIQTGINMLIDLLVEKLNGPDAGFIKKTLIPEIIKKYSTALFSSHPN